MTNESSSPLQNAAVAEQGAQAASERASSKKGASQKKSAPKAKQGAKQAKPTAKKEAKAGKKPAKPERTATAPRAESKGARILEMSGRAKGATLAEIQKATDWQAHSVRGFPSSAAKKHNLKIESSKNETGERVYKLVK